jgi:hypothetical protein
MKQLRLCHPAHWPHVAALRVAAAVAFAFAAAAPALPLPVSLEGGHVYPNDGAAYFKACFRLVVFRPFVGQVLVGTLTACTK